MPDTNASDLLLETARRAVKRGQPERARAVLRALALQHPHDRRVWEALADVAADEQERREVLNQLSSQPIADLQAPVLLSDVIPQQQPETSLQLPAAVALMPHASEDTTARKTQIRWPTYLVIGITALIVALLVLWRWAPTIATTADPMPTQAVITDPLPTIAVNIATVTILPTSAIDQALPTQTAIPSSTAVAASPTPILQPTIAPTATPRPSLPLGQVIQNDQWNMALLRPKDALLLDGSIGTLQPQGRFVLVLLAIGNTSSAPSRIPDGLIVLQDEKGNRYKPMPAASTAYLSSYGRGQSGDLSFDEPIPSDAGNLSVPIIFDVPIDARGLQIVIGNGPMGWVVSGS